MRSWEHCGDHLLSDISKCTSNLHCEHPRYVQRLHNGNFAEGCQPFGAVDVVVPTWMVIAGLDVEIIHVGAHGKNLSENEGEVRNVMVI